MLPKQKVKIRWSADFAYAIGLLVTDGNLSKDNRHISFTSKDYELIENLQIGLGINENVGKKARGGEKEKKYFVLEFSDVIFYRFLLSIGLMPAKSKILGEIAVPRLYMRDFLRGHFDGDGSFFSYFDPRWRSSFMFYTSFLSASKDHILWLQAQIQILCGVIGHITKSKTKNSVYQLKYAKTESKILIRALYYKDNLMCLTRKQKKVINALQFEKNLYARVL